MQPYEGNQIRIGFIFGTEEPYGGMKENMYCHSYKMSRNENKRWTKHSDVPYWVWQEEALKFLKDVKEGKINDIVAVLGIIWGIKELRFPDIYVFDRFRTINESIEYNYQNLMYKIGELGTWMLLQDIGTLTPERSFKKKYKSKSL